MLGWRDVSSVTEISLHYKKSKEYLPRHIHSTYENEHKRHVSLWNF